jgi:hypothetical protein
MENGCFHACPGLLNKLFLNCVFHMLRNFLLAFCLFARLWGTAQGKWAYNVNVNFGCNLILVHGRGQVFSGAKIFAGLSANADYNNSFLLNYGPSLSIYTKALGANLNPLVGDIQIDFTNSFTFGPTWGGQLSYYKNFRTIATGSYYNVVTNTSGAFLLSTNFIINNHGRNQTDGSITISFPGVTINYYNDGGTPFDFLPLGDDFDRWWTGGFGIYLHNRQGYNTAEFSFDQFTGYSPLLFELSNVIGINLPSYDLPGDSLKRPASPPAFNTSTYNLKIYLGQGIAIDAGVMGNLRTNDGKVFGLQDIIHSQLGYSLHPNYDMNRFYLGGTYNYFSNVKTH